ncbi:MAG: hypothetical protein QXT88_02025 [Desulfurococcaceae archaeon]|uniref:Uncharacterized protein n=1 Tax=Staphylothermus marinus TaxID=2280 RepID=A0A7J3KGH0_STAMA
MVENRFGSDEVEIIDSRTMIINLKPRVRVVSFKLDENTLKAFDQFMKKYGLNSRSMVLKSIVSALVKLSENIGNGKLIEICMAAKYVDGEEKIASICFKT